ncbi:MAG: hypothetical protein RR425_03160 [Erysipelotrichales bacterium]
MIQFHDAQHILSAILEKDYGLATVSHHVHEFDCDLFLDGPITEQVMNEVELKANQLIYEHKRLDTLLINKEDLIKYNIEDKDIYTNPVRITNIESLDDFNACGCMHFNNLSYVQMIKCFKVEKVNKDYKLLFSAGISLSNYFNVIYDNYREVQKVLKANDDNYLERFNSINNKSIELTKKLASYKEEYYKEVIKDVDSSFFIYEVKESEDLRILATLLINKERPIKGYLYYQNENAYQFCIFKQTDDEYSISDLLNRLKEDYQINGGGKGLIISGQTNEDLSSIILDYIS